ncbi:MAG: Flp pilus assembly protein CpaB [Fuerstiella sp.]
MKNQTVILLIVAGACGLVTMLGVKQYLARQNHKEEVPKVQVLVAAAPIKQGTQLSEKNTQFITVDAETCPEDAVRDLEQIKERALKVPRGQGDWILVSQLTEKGDIGAVIGIPNGMRVTTIPVDATTTHSGMLQPGNRIDLLLTYRERDAATGQQKEKTIPLLEYIEVFAVDSQKFGIDASTENAKARNISLLVDTEQAMKLTLAIRKGTISTVLRSSEDMDKIKITELTEDSLNGTNHGEIKRRSTLEVQEQFTETPGFVLPDPEPNIMTQLQAELELNGPSGSGPVPPAETNTEDDDQYWVMAIHQGGGVRVERVNLNSDEPIDTTGTKLPAVTAPRTKPAAGLEPVAVPGSDSLPSIPELNPESADDADNGGLSELQEAATGLLDDLFN